MEVVAKYGLGVWNIGGSNSIYGLTHGIHFHVKICSVTSRTIKI